MTKGSSDIRLSIERFCAAAEIFMWTAWIVVAVLVTAAAAIWFKDPRTRL